MYLGYKYKIELPEEWDYLIEQNIVHKNIKTDKTQWGIYFSYRRCYIHICYENFPISGNPQLKQVYTLEEFISRYVECRLTA